MTLDMCNFHSPTPSPLLHLTVTHPLRTNFFPSAAFYCGTNQRWQLQFSPGNTQHQLAKTTTALQVNEYKVRGIFHNLRKSFQRYITDCDSPLEDGLWCYSSHHTLTASPEHQNTCQSKISDRKKTTQKIKRTLSIVLIPTQCSMEGA